MHMLALALLCLLPLFALGAEDYYKLLNLERSASEREIKKAYRTLSKKFHPDKNPGDDTAHQKFVEISEAYDVLSDDELRKVYNQYGHEGVKQRQQGGQRGGGGHDPFDIFSRFFGGGGGRGGGGQRQGQGMQVEMSVPLRDFYVGGDHQFSIEKQIICESCDGSGSQDGQRETCNKCNGQGIVIQKQQLMPGIFQQMQMQCDVCGGKGSKVKHKCKTCDGHRVVKGSETYQLGVEKGMPSDARVNFEGEGDESPDWTPGDLVVQLKEATPQLGTDDAHRTDGTFFRRKGTSLFWREVLSLREAWMGDWTRNLTHLDGHIVALSRKRGEVVQPGTVEVIEGEGMPVWRHDGGSDPAFGKLHVEYVIVLPDQMESGMEKEFWALWEKWRKKNGVDLNKDSGRPAPKHDEL